MPTSNSAVLTVSASAPAAVAPSIVTQPASVTANVGSTATLAVGVDGTGPFSFQWRRDGVNIAGATSAVLTFNSVALPNAGSFSVVVTNSAGSVTSSNAVLDVSAAATPTAPTITSQPSTLIVPYRGSGVVAVGATGSGPLSYQWSKDGAELPGATLPVLDFRIVADVDVGTYTVTISNSMGSVVSRAVDIILLGAPVITQQPADVTVLEGADAYFYVAGEQLGPALPVVDERQSDTGRHWQHLRTSRPVVAANSGAVYSVIVYNGAGLRVQPGRGAHGADPRGADHHAASAERHHRARRAGRDVRDHRRHADVRRAAATLEWNRMGAGHSDMLVNNNDPGLLFHRRR